MEMQILDNKVQGRVIDKLRENIKFGTRLLSSQPILQFMLMKN